MHPYETHGRHGGSPPLASFRVIGRPYPQGSKTAFAVKTKAGKHIGRTRESSGLDHAAWRNAVSEAAQAKADEVGTLDGPMKLTVTFRFPMPSNSTMADRDRGWRWKVTQPDTSKLVRAVEDALQAAKLITDDARFAVVDARKIETSAWIGADLTIDRLVTP